MNAPQPIIHKGRKFDQVLNGARDVFLRDGFSGASVDEIARVAQVSKATLYKYFPDKGQMFMEVARRECQRQADEAVDFIDPQMDPRMVLTFAATKITTFMLSDFAQRFFRICVAEADRFPELGRAFYETGPLLGRERLGDYFREATEAGRLCVNDPGFAADQFAELCKADLWTQVVFGIRSDFTQQEVDRVISGAVDVFLARYGC